MLEVRMWMSFEDEAECQLSGCFSDEDIKMLKMFRDHVEALLKTKVIADGWPKHHNLKWKPETGLSIESEPIDAEYLSSFLHCLRPIILHEEPASFDRVSGLIGRRFSHRFMKRHLKAIRQHFETSQFASYGQVTIADVPIFDQDTVRKWLYGFEYHQDLDKRKELETVIQGFGRNEVRAIFISQMRDRCNGVFHLDHLVSFILDSEETLNAAADLPENSLPQ